MPLGEFSFLVNRLPLAESFLCFDLGFIMLEAYSAPLKSGLPRILRLFQGLKEVLQSTFISFLELSRSIDTVLVTSLPGDWDTCL